MLFLFSILLGFAHAEMTPAEIACFTRAEDSGALFSTYDTNTMYQGCFTGVSDAAKLHAVNQAVVSKWVLGCGLRATEGKVRSISRTNNWICKKNPSGATRPVTRKQTTGSGAERMVCTSGSTFV